MSTYKWNDDPSWPSYFSWGQPPKVIPFQRQPSRQPVPAAPEAPEDQWSRGTEVRFVRCADTAETDELVHFSSCIWCIIILYIYVYICTYTYMYIYIYICIIIDIRISHTHTYIYIFLHISCFHVWRDPQAMNANVSRAQAPAQERVGPGGLHPSGGCRRRQRLKERSALENEGIQ